MRTPVLAFCLSLLLVGSASAQYRHNIRCVGSCPMGIMELALGGDYVYVADPGIGLRVVSVGDPAHPSEIGHLLIREGVAGVAVNGSYAYVATVDSGLYVISVADPAVPFRVGRCDLPSYVSGMGADGGYVYVTDTLSRLRVISVADPAHPVEVGHLDTPGATFGVVVAGEYAYVGVSDNGFEVISIADPAHPVEVGSISFTGEPVYVGVTGDTAYCSNGTTLYAVSIADPAHPLQIGHIYSLNHNPFRLIVDGGYAYTAESPDSRLAIYQYYDSTQLGDLDVDNDSLDVVADTLRLQLQEVAYPLGTRSRAKTGDSPSEQLRQTRCGTVPVFAGMSGAAVGAFVLANTDSLYNPDTADGPSLSQVDALSFTTSLTGPGGTLDSILIPNLPESLAQGQTVVCTLAVYVPDSLPAGDYTGPVVITGLDPLHYLIAETVYARVRKEAEPTALGDLDVDKDSLDLTQDTMNLHTQPAGPVYSPYAKAEFMLVNSSQSYNPDMADGPSRSTLREVEVEAEVEAQGRAARRVNSECRIVKSGSDFHSSQFTLDSSAVGIYVLNLPESLAVGQAVECTLALVITVGESLGGHVGWVTISAFDTLGYQVRDSFVLAVRGPQPRQNLDSLRVAPIPFKPNQNPEHDAIHFQGLSSGARVTVYDASGQSVWSATESGDGHLKWDAKVASGIYMYLVVAKDGESKVGKLSVIR